MNIQSNIIIMYCNVCGKPYKKLLKAGKGKNGTYSRPYRSYTCSKKCSLTLSYLRKGVIQRSNTIIRETNRFN